MLYKELGKFKIAPVTTSVVDSDFSDLLAVVLFVLLLVGLMGISLVHAHIGQFEHLYTLPL
jgi:hypothetical protein